MESDDAQKAISGLQDLLARFQGQLQSESDDFERSDRSRNLPSPARDTSAEESLALDDAENPLQLLARASDLQLSPTGVHHVAKSPLRSEVPLPQESSELGMSAKSFFVPARAHLDVGSELDPVDLGLVTFDEAESLFSL